jgi:two-component system CheB/CheR fusion protein
MTTAAEVNLEVLLDFVKRNRGFDFTGYKRSSLERRIGKRMEEVGAAGYPDYLDYLEVHQDEFVLLFNTILINVTGFFRDPPTWDYLREDVLPALVAAHGPDDPIRVWCTGCASGEEAYTVAMVLADLLGVGDFRERVKIYATDVDEEALQTARAASYSAKQVEPVPREALDRYFERSSGRYGFRPDLRRTVIFGRNDLVQDAPISRIDLLLCRNTLMYFNAETQARILRRFHFALEDAGALVLGKSEMLITHGGLFQPIDLKRRVFRTAGVGAPRERLHFPPSGGGDGTGDGEPSLRDSAFDASPVAQIVIDGQATLTAVNQAAREMLGLNAGDLGRPLQDLEVSYRPLELRSHLDQLRADGQPVALRGVSWRPPAGRSRVLDVQLTPLTDGDERYGASVAYVDVTSTRALQDELDRSRHELEQAYEELQSTVEELETTNEELQSTNEELETTNEELQSTNEELETMNEELQSTNEELETINDELRIRGVELDAVNGLLETILATLGKAVVVLDAGLTVRVWNRHAEELWGVRAEEADGQSFLGLDIGLPVEALRACIRTAIVGQERAEVTVEATNRRGRFGRCHVVALPATFAGDAAGSVVLLMELTAGDGP